MHAVLQSTSPADRGTPSPAHCAHSLRLAILHHSPLPHTQHVAGVFDEPGVGKGLRITNIYVSSDESIYNGRRNWSERRRGRLQFAGC